ncbi:hypothetical protein KJZ99_07415 [bacterium]|nr:hypothetical protein [bacterium]
MKDKLLWFGTLLCLSAFLGFATVADDFRHLNELAAVAAIFALGAVMTGIALRAKRRHYMIPESRSLWSGIVLTLFGILGFGFVADDFKHAGEVLGSAAVLLAGVTLLFLTWRKHRLPSPD